MRLIDADPIIENYEPSSAIVAIAKEQPTVDILPAALQEIRNTCKDSHCADCRFFVKENDVMSRCLFDNMPLKWTLNDLAKVCLRENEEDKR